MRVGPNPTPEIISAPSHVALLVRSVESVAEQLRKLGFKIGSPMECAGEGTREIYVEREKGNSLLLMEPVKPGAYQRAMDKRGPGLHHLAIDVLNLDRFMASISSSGWLLHPMSMQTIVKTKTAWFARPGFPALIEVQERVVLKTGPVFVKQIGLAAAKELSKLTAAMGLREIVRQTNAAPWIAWQDEKIAISALCEGRGL